MTREEFAGLAAALAEYFGRRQTISQDRLALWYEQCRHVPGGEPLAWIKDRLLQEEDHLPSNLPKAVRRLWGEWCQTHPERMVRDPDLTECSAPGCDEGYIWVVNPTTGYTAVAFCDRCAVRRGLVREGHPGLSNLKALEAMGWVEDDRA